MWLALYGLSLLIKQPQISISYNSDSAFINLFLNLIHLWFSSYLRQVIISWWTLLIKYSTFTSTWCTKRRSEFYLLAVCAFSFFKHQIWGGALNLSSYKHKPKQTTDFSHGNKRKWTGQLVSSMQKSQWRFHIMTITTITAYKRKLMIGCIVSNECRWCQKHSQKVMVQV